MESGSGVGGESVGRSEEKEEEGESLPVRNVALFRTEWRLVKI